MNVASRVFRVQKREGSIVALVGLTFSGDTSIRRGSGAYSATCMLILASDVLAICDA
jgi:hypothetical protein